MSINKNVPEIRFKGTSGVWKSKDFGLCLENIPSNTLSRADLNYDAGLAKNIHYGDVLIKFGEVLDVKNEILPFITDNDIAKKLKRGVLKNGDIIIADAAEDKTVGKCTELFNIDKQVVVSGLHTIAVRPKINFSSKYLGYYLNSAAYHDQILSLMQGTKVLSISKKSIQNTLVVFPSETKEQSQIGEYFYKLDSLINQHQKKHDKLSSIKKGMLEKIFPKQGEAIPEIRFEEFSGDWEEKEFSKEVEFFSGLTYSPNDIQKTGTLVIRSSNVKNGQLVQADNVYVNPEVVNCNNVIKGDIAVVVRNGSRSLIGKHAQVTSCMDNTVIGAFMTGIRSTQSEFINALLDTNMFTAEVEKNLGATINQITNGAFKNMIFMFPTEDEQYKIGQYFNKLDKIINQHQQQITKLNNIKQACLVKMFV
tara:strand:- start:199 stop:1464 length:1266 start_codon:yes stop_codon:yes gene_type:complete